MIKIKAHPIAALDFIMPLWIVTAASILGRLFSAGVAEIAISSAVAVIIILVQAFLRAAALRIYIAEEKIIFEKGVLFKSREEIAKRRVATVSFSQNPLQRAFGAVCLRVSTEAGGRRADAGFPIRRGDFADILRALGFEAGAKSIKMGARRTALMAAAISSAAIGVPTAVPLINRLGKLFDRDLAQNALSLAQSGDASALASAIGLLFLLIYAVAFCFLVARSLSMRIALNGDTVFVGAGLLPRRNTYFKRVEINAITVEQRPLMRLIDQYIIRVDVAGCRDRRGDGSVVVPAAEKRELAPFLKLFFSARRPVSLSAPYRGSFWRFIRIRLLLCLIVPAAIYFSGTVFVAFSELFALFAFFALVLMLYLLYLSALSAKTSAIAKGEPFFYARSVSGFSVKELYFKRERVALLRLRRLKADKRYGSCTLKLYLLGKGGERIKVKYINYAAAREYCTPPRKN